MASAQVAKEQQTEKQLNQFSEQVIGMTAWGKFYGLMRGAASAGEGAIPHKVCVDQSGRNVTVYNSRAGKVVGTFLKPSHEYTMQFLSRKQYGKALLSLTGVYGQLHSMREQKRANCFTVTPNDVLQMEERRQRQLAEDKKSGKKVLTDEQRIKKSKANANIFAGAVVGVSALAVFGMFLLAKKASQK